MQPPPMVVQDELVLTDTPSVAALLLVLVPFGCFGLASGAMILFLGRDVAVPGIALAFVATLALAGIVTFAIARRRPVRYRLCLTPDGVLLRDRSGAWLGRLGTPPLSMTPGHWLSGARGETRENQCVVLGNGVSIGTWGAFPTYGAFVPRLAKPDYALPPPQWAKLVSWLPELRAIQRPGARRT